ncbi:RNA dependent RNA polymerase-domain-containing protein [Trametes meyenii]|nr:RNA dependent RNA polymerase-domain-containing protein [Trametes meyenii]
MDSDSENEFWAAESASQGTRFTRLARVESKQRSTYARPGDDSGSDSSEDPSAAVPGSFKGKQPVRYHSASYGDCESTAGSDEDDDAVVEEVLLDTESDSSQVPSKNVSFAFSGGYSTGNSSMTSLGSSTSYDVVTGRKRVLEYEDTMSTPIAPGLSTSSKQQKLSKQAVHSSRPDSSSAPPTSYSKTRNQSNGEALDVPTEPRTPHRPHPITPSGSPTPYRGKVETPVINTVQSLMNAIELTTSPAPPDGVHIIAHSANVQRLFDKYNVAWGAQYELARGVSRGWWTWDDITSSYLKDLGSVSKDAVLRMWQKPPRNPPVGAVVYADAQLWAELDREELAICEGQLRGLGLKGAWQNTEDWYGGKVQQVARVEEMDGKMQLVLAPMEMRKSCRFARFLGSRRMLQVSIPQELRTQRGGDLTQFFLQKFLFCGRIFVAFGAKDGKVFLMETNEDYERGGRTPGDERRMSLEDFVAWHNPMDRNGDQAVSKWATRFDLGFSISVPALVFGGREMFNTEDQYVDKTAQKPPAEHIYTDGCGYMNAAALSLIAKRMGYESMPTAVQGRIAGAKGLWMLHPRDRSLQKEPKIWIRKSQRKIQLDHDNLHLAHRTFDLLAPPRVTHPSRLSRLTILNLSHNKVPTSVFVDLMRSALDEEVRALTQWTHPQDMQLLWKTVDRIGRVTGSRIQQFALGASRALGLSGRIREDDMPWDEPSDPLQELLDITGGDTLSEEDYAALIAELESTDAAPQRLRDRFSGEPLTLHGVVLDLLQAGFHPLQSRLLYDKIKTIINKAIEDVVRDFHVTIPLSAEAFIVPDPHGVLKENEIHFKSSKDLKPPLEDPHPKMLLEEVLIYRNPCRLPSDIQKVTAVCHEDLSEYVDVVVLPTTGPCSFASMLAGGDYDGDVCVCIYDPHIVKKFRNLPPTKQLDNFIVDNFQDQGKIEQVAAVAAEMSSITGDPDRRRKKLQGALLSDITLPPVGAYSMFHENAAYSHGYDAPETIRNAFMFNTILDSRKSGLRVQDEVFRRDKKRYDRRRPLCLQGSGNADPISNVADLPRPQSLGRFILDELMEAGKEMRDTYLARYDQLSPVFDMLGNRDPHLRRPYEAALPFMENPLFQRDLTAIKDHIKKHIEMWQKLTRDSKPSPHRTPSRTPARKWRGAVGPSTPAERQRGWKDLTRSFADGPVFAADSPLALADVEALKASWAYHEKPNFAWKVAFQALCRLKASSHWPVAMTGQFADTVTIPPAAVRVFERNRLGMA